MSIAFNYRHLYYFWVVAREGGLSRAAEKLDMAVQTVSAQVRELERSLGCALLKPSGRALVLTEAGVAAMKQADQIFQMGEALPALVRQASGTPAVRLAAGISDGMPRLVVHRLLQPAIRRAGVRLRCVQGDFNSLLGELALHRLDIVIADRPAPPNPNIRLYSHAAGMSPIAWYGTPTLLKTARKGFPASLADVPVVLPTSQIAVRAHLDAWFERHGVQPRIAGEFDDSALLKTFGAAGMGIFPAAEWVHDELIAHYAVRKLATCDGVNEHFYAIGTEKKVQHPLVQRLLQTTA
ncbi:MAG: LysR family transcriptional regulator [Pseudomonadota bacterium]